MTMRKFKPSTKEIGRILTRYHFTIALIVVILIAALEGIFLYRYFWKTFTASRLIVSLKQQAAISRVEIERFKKIEAFHELKTKPREINISELYDLFTRPTPQPRP